jgi:DNA-binding FadR family transcriptional regulator
MWIDRELKPTIFNQCEEWFTMFRAADSEQPALATLRNFLFEQKLALNGRLPAERQLCREIGLSRSQLRKALAVLEAEGQIWRHVGRGTFIGPRPVINLNDVEFLTNQTSPTEVMEARLAVEPQLARLASLHGTASNFAEIRRCNRRCRAAREWRVYEAWDNNFHQAIASATYNKVLISLFDTLNIVRRSTVWGQLRSTKLPPADHDSFNEHDAIYEAITGRNPDQAAECMRIHLRTVRNRVLSSVDL